LANGCHFQGVVGALEATQVVSTLLVYVDYDPSSMASRGQLATLEDGRIVGGEEWQEKVHNREEWKQLRTATNRRILHMPME
jgi:hypothetical protein